MQEDSIYADIIIDRAHSDIDKPFKYLIPQNLRNKIALGSRVMVPFGKKQYGQQGYVFNITDNLDIEPEKIKSVIDVMDDFPALFSKMLPLVEYIKTNYFCTTIDAVHLMVPSGLRKNIKPASKKIIELIMDCDEAKAISRSENMKRIIDYLNEHGSCEEKELLSETNTKQTSIKTLLNKKIVSYYRKGKNIKASSAFLNDTKVKLTKDQSYIIDTVKKSLSTKAKKYLLHGVTGGGKTEIYMQLSQIAIEAGKQVIILVPEISLTPQTIGKFKARFGESTAVFHSRLSEGEKYSEWLKIKNGEADIVVGARSAVFAPFPNLGLIIIDECHETSYKSSKTPRYHAKHIAEFRSVNENATVLLGSATPTLDEYYEALNGKEYTLLTLKNRINNISMPHVNVIDMREELVNGNKNMLSGALYYGLKNALDKGHQALLLLNRRGFAQFVSCRSCGYVIKCPHCDVSLTYHAHEKIVKCHYCGQIYSYPTVCPACNSKYIKHFGVGTQQLEANLENLFPDAKIFRMDADTTKNVNSHQNILSDFLEKKIDILIGTKMIAKGLDFENVTVVGILAADASINFPDYNSYENAYSLFSQVSGRAGRGRYKGEVFLQTYEPDNYIFDYVKEHDYIGFYDKEITLRKRFLYPPFVHIIKMVFSGVNQGEVISKTRAIERKLKMLFSESEKLSEKIVNIDACAATIEKVNDIYRWNLFIRIKPDKKSIKMVHRIFYKYIYTEKDKNVNMFIDFYPISLI